MDKTNEQAVVKDSLTTEQTQAVPAGWMHAVEWAKRLPLTGSCSLKSADILAVDAMLAAAPQAQPVEAEQGPAGTVQLVGAKDGIETVIGTATMPPKMKARELVCEMFGAWEHDDGSDADLAYAVCEQLIEWMPKNPPTFNVESKAKPAQPVEAEQAAAVAPEALAFSEGIKAAKSGMPTSHAYLCNPNNDGSDLARAYDAGVKFVSAPAAQPVREPMSDELICKLATPGYNGFAQQALYDFRAFARAIERHHGITKE